MQEENRLCTEYQKLYASARIDFMGKTVTIAQLIPDKQDPDRAVRKAATEAEGGFFDQHRQELDELYDNLVKNRTQQAKKLGFENYVPLGFLRMGRNCYSPEDLDSFRSQVVRDLVPPGQLPQPGGPGPGAPDRESQSPPAEASGAGQL